MKNVTCAKTFETDLDVSGFLAFYLFNLNGPSDAGLHGLH